MFALLSAVHSVPLRYVPVLQTETTPPQGKGGTALKLLYVSSVLKQAHFNINEKGTGMVFSRDAFEV